MTLSFSLLVFFTFHAAVAWSADNSFCLNCHADETLKKTDAQGRSIPLFVSKAEFEKSVHGHLSCSDCHTNIQDESHADEGKRPSEQHAGCATCHEKEAREYQQSVHAKAIAKGAMKAASCHDCHGKHDILSSKVPESLTHPSNIEETCNRCHSDKEFVREHALRTGPTPGELFRESVHGKTGEVTCVSCHRSHDLRSLIDPESSIFRSNLPQTCGACHPEITEQFIQSIHGVLAARGKTDAPTCTTCHGIHGIKAKSDPTSPVHERRIAMTTCPQCHGAERISKEYRFTTIPVRSYYDSFHGLSYRGGDTYSANCASCHGVHNIRPSWDPNSLVHRDNLQKTCGACHPRASENFARGKIHSLVSVRGEEFGERIVGWVRLFYIILIVTVVGGMLFFNLTDWLRKTIDRKP